MAKNPKMHLILANTLVFLVTTLGGLFGATPCDAYVLLSSRKATLPVSSSAATLTFDWDGKAPPIDKKEKFADGLYANLDDSAFMEQLLTIALKTWNDVPGSYINLAFRRSDQPVDLDEEDKRFAIVTNKSDNLSTAAFAKPHVDPENPSTIIDCDISISDTETAAQSLLYTITHEVGHCIGLGHSHTNYNAIMGYSRSQSGYIQLGADDMAGVIFLYPDPNYAKGDPKDIVCGAVAHRRESPRDPAFRLLFLLLPLIAAVAWGRLGTKRT